MARGEVIRQQMMMEKWRRRTGNATYKGIHKDSKTRKAEEHMKAKPYGGRHEGIMDGNHA